MDDATPPGTAATPARPHSPTPAFVWAAATLASVAGFGLGGALFGALFGPRPGLWWPAAAQAHGHVQVFGWAGLMVLGVGLHFLPRLRGAALAAPGLAPWVLALYGGGVALRAVAQPLAAARPALIGLLPLAALLELAGATIAVGMLVATSRRAVPLRERAGMVPVLPFVAMAFGSLWLSLLLNLLGWALAVGSGLPLLTAPWELLVVHLGLVGFLTPCRWRWPRARFRSTFACRSRPRGRSGSCWPCWGPGWYCACSTRSAGRRRSTRWGAS